MAKKEIMLAAAKELLGNESVQSFLCGTYSDGSPRSLPDAISGEILSPKQKRRKQKKEDEIKERIKKKKKKKKKPVKLKL